MKKLLVICGPTATGKTSLGIKLAKIIDGEIVSSDSRQVYKYMDIGTGKELPVNSKLVTDSVVQIPNSKFNGVYEIDGVSVWGYDLAEPNEEYNVSKYFKETKQVIDDIWQRKKTPIIVGGTGLYIKSLIDGIPTVDIPKNQSLRDELEKMSVSELFNKLATLDSTKAASLNSSDSKNKRRLIRAIEVAVWSMDNEAKKPEINLRKEILGKDVDVLQIGISSDLDFLKLKIKERVMDRINNGFIDEVESLLKHGVSWKMQSMKSLGYKESEAFFKQGLSFEEFVETWERNEINYVKRQMTWFKKDKRIVWFDIQDKNYLKDLENMVKKWYSTTNAT